jgi:myo-inositol-1-phosphate synthase
MIENVRVAVVGVGNNTSAGVGGIEFVSAFAISDDRVGKDLHEAIFLPPNNFPDSSRSCRRRECSYSAVSWTRLRSNGWRAR